MAIRDEPDDNQWTSGRAQVRPCAAVSAVAAAAAVPDAAPAAAAAALCLPATSFDCFLRSQGVCLSKGLIREFQVVNVPGNGRREQGPLLSARLVDFDRLWRRAQQLLEISAQVLVMGVCYS